MRNDEIPSADPGREILVFTPLDAAAELRCSRATIYRAIERGELQAVRLGPNGTYRIPRSALAAFVSGGNK